MKRPTGIPGVCRPHLTTTLVEPSLGPPTDREAPAPGPPRAPCSLFIAVWAGLNNMPSAAGVGVLGGRQGFGREIFPPLKIRNPGPEMGVRATRALRGASAGPKRTRA
jgi:hypothetical protein